MYQNSSCLPRSSTEGARYTSRTGVIFQDVRSCPRNRAVTAGERGRLYLGLRGWRRCEGEQHLRPLSDMLDLKASMSRSLSTLREWALAFALLVGRRPRACDLFCGEGGISQGLALAGFDVVAVDLVGSPHFTAHPHVTFAKGNALEMELSGFDVVFASPPCQAHSTMKCAAWAHVVSQHADLIDETKERCLQAGIPFVIENVVGAGSKLRSPLGSCGGMFGLQVARLGIASLSPPCPDWITS